MTAVLAALALGAVIALVVFVGAFLATTIIGTTAAALAIVLGVVPATQESVRTAVFLYALSGSLSVTVIVAFREISRLTRGEGSWINLVIGGGIFLAFAVVWWNVVLPAVSLLAARLLLGAI